MEQKQSTAMSEWSALSDEKRQIIILPLLDAVEKFTNDVEKSGCPVLATYLEQFLNDFLIDLLLLVTIILAFPFLVASKVFLIYLQSLSHYNAFHHKLDAVRDT